MTYSSSLHHADDAQTPIGFSVGSSTADVQGLGLLQTVKFDDVHYNAGNGYDPITGAFTAPLSGTYVFFLQVRAHRCGSIIGTTSDSRSKDPIFFGLKKTTTHLIIPFGKFGPPYPG